jgi:CDGSH-type Zn-finger protein
LPYPLRSAEELAGCLIFHGLLDESAWHDPEGWDGGNEKDRVHTMLDAIRDTAGHEWEDGCLVKDGGRKLQWRLQFCQCGESREKPDSRTSSDNETSAGTAPEGEAGQHSKQ